jgi:hypothetical protein
MTKSSIESNQPKNENELKIEDNLNEEDFKRFKELKGEFNTLIEETPDGLKGLCIALNSPMLDLVLKDLQILIEKAKNNKK